MSVLPSFKHVFSSIAETEPVARGSTDDTQAAMHLQTAVPSTLPLSSSQTDGRLSTANSLPRITTTTITTKSTTLPSSMIPNCDVTPNRNALDNDKTANTVNGRTSRPGMSLLPLDQVSDATLMFGFEARVPPRRQQKGLEPLPFNKQTLGNDGQSLNEFQERVRRRERSRTTLSFSSQHKRRRVQAGGADDAGLDTAIAKMSTMSSGPDTTAWVPTSAGQQSLVRIGPATAPSIVHTPSSVDRMSSVSDPLYVSPSHLPEADRRICGPTIEGSAEEARRRGRSNGSGFFSGSGSGSGSGSVGGGSHGGAWPSTASMFRSGSLRVGSLLESPRSTGPPCDVDRVDTARHGMQEQPQLLALARDSTGGAPADVLSIPAQRSLHSALSSRTILLPGAGTHTGAPGGTSRTGICGSGAVCGALSVSQWPTASDLSHLGGVRNALTQGEDRAADNRSDLVDGTDSIATKHTGVATMKNVDNIDGIQEESGQIGGNASTINGGGYDHRKWKQEAVVTTITTTAGANNRYAQEVSDDAAASSVIDIHEKQQKNSEVRNDDSNEALCQEKFVGSNTEVPPSSTERKSVQTITKTVNTTPRTVPFATTNNTTQTTSVAPVTATAMEATAETTDVVTVGTEALAAAADNSSGEDHLVQCPQCPRRLRNQVTLQNHIRVVHDHNGNFRCTHRQCGLTFMWRSTLSNHVRLVHEKQRPYVCSECGKAFRWNSHLREHFWVVHKGEKPFKCDTCGKSFGRKNNMQKHMRKHADPSTATDNN